MCNIVRVYLGEQIKFIASSKEIFDINYKELSRIYGEDNLRVEYQVQDNIALDGYLGN